MIDKEKIKKHLIKKIFKTVLVFWIFYLLFFWVNNDNTYAQTDATQTQTQEQQAASQKAIAENTLDKSLQEIKALLDIVLKIIYMVSRPLLVIAGNAMDNSLVYWSVFHLDVPLWKFWNIMKNFANYALWVVLLYHILKSLFSWKWLWSFKEKDSPLWIVKNILIAGILIQASRFLLSAVIDISTIATYAVGGMPLTILKNSNLWDQKILGVNSSMNLSDSTSTSKTIMEDIVIYRTYWSDPQYKIADCRIWSWWNANKYIIGKKTNFISQSGVNSTWWIPLKTWMCILGGIPYKFNEFPELLWKTTNSDYTKTLGEILAGDPSLTQSWFEECWFIIPMFAQLKYDPSGSSGCIKYRPGIDTTSLLSTGDFWSDWWSGWLNSIKWWTTLSTLIDKSKWFVGPLITIYSSTLNFWQLIDTDSWWDALTFGIVLKFMIKAFIWIMLILPILALAIIMLARIWILWITIAATPIIIIDQIFEFKIFDKMEFLKIWNIIKLIFAPVLVVFWLSIALIFMSTLSSILSQNKTDFTNPSVKTQKESTLEWLWITKPAGQQDCYTVLWTQTFCIKLNIWWGLDNISYLLINIFGIAIMRSLLFWTIKQTWSIGESVWTGLEKFWKDFAWNVPIVPIGWWVWFNQIAWSWGSGWILNTMSSKITNNMSNANEDRLAGALPWRWFKTLEEREAETNKWAKNNNSQTINETEATKIMTQIKSMTEVDQTERETKIKTIVKEQTWKEINWTITDWIRQPENVKLLFAQFEKLNATEQPKVQEALKSLLDIKSIKDYKDKYDKKELDITDIMKNLDSKLLEALVVIPIWTEITTKGDKKYKITKKGDKYEKEEITTPPKT